MALLQISTRIHSSRMRTAVAVSWGGQGSHLFGLTKFHDISIIFPGFFLVNFQVFFKLLSPANEVWGKVIFLHLFAILFTGGACVVVGGVHVCGGHAWLQGGMCGCRGACVVAGGMCGWGHV